MPTEWKIFYFKVFNELYKALTKEVILLRKKDPTGFVKHPKTKLLRRVRDKIRYDIAKDPTDPAFHLGNTLGKKYKSWKRVKKRGLPGRYRLFFKYHSTDKSIIIAWLNDETCLRKEGSHSDVYNVFLKMLLTSEIPTKWNELKNRSVGPQKKD